MRIGIGIDTGGTYTDAVIIDFDDKSILGTAKALTTKHDLSEGILEALDALPAELLQKAEAISLSTTLATNACVEDKGGKAKLIFFGGDRKVLSRYGMEYGLPPVNEIYIQESFTSFSGEIEREPDWELFNEALDSGFDELDGVGIIEMNAMRNSAVVEKKAKELFRERCSIPVICSHELFNELNCLRRGASALLNARLVPIIDGFIKAINRAIAERGIEAAVVIARSDGSLMSEEFAYIRPVETLLCGPASSVMGSAYLANEQNSIVVDMGGTTTDIALINNGIPHKAAQGVSVGKWKTFVDGLYIKTIGLGGDTAIHYNGAKLFLEDYRVVPLCVAAEKYPEIIENLKKLLDSKKKHTKYLHEHYLLNKNISDSPRYTKEEKLLCAALGAGPMPIREASKMVPGKDMYTLDVSRLLKEDVIQVCGLTPTDIMHIKGDFNRFSTDAAVLGAGYAAYNIGISVDELCLRVYDEIKRRLYVNVVKAMLENKDKYYLQNGVGKEIEKLINDSYDMAKTGFRHEFITMMFKTDFSLIGVGAPVHIFLSDVAAMLGTKAVLPKHYEVANALGAIVGNVSVTSVIEIKTNHEPEGLAGYTVFGNSETRVFEKLEAAEEFAILEAENSARSEAIRRGAQGEITVTHRLNKSEAELKDSTLHLGTQAIADAIGGLGFSTKKTTGQES